MRISNIILIFIIVFLFYLTGCEKQVHRMDMDPVKTRLVLNGSLGPDLPFKLHISSSMEPIGPELVDLVEDAEISVTDDSNNTFYPQYDSMGFYLADWYPEINKKYRITVKAPGFEEAFVSVTIPEPLISVSLSKDSADINYPYVLTFKDHQGEENTYMIRAWYQYKEIHQHWISPGITKIDTIIERRLAVIHSADELISYHADGINFGDIDVSMGDKGSTGFLISDEFFDGREHVLRFKATYIQRLDMGRPYLFVDLVSVENEFYDFVKSYTLYFDALQTPFAEPVAILSNIENGLGFVYGYSVHTDSILLK
jgi:hypothetical protein